MRKRRSNNISIMSLILILIFFGIRMMLPNSSIIENEEISNEDFQSALVTKVVDGDTIWVEISGIEEKVRFIGVNTPEKGQLGYEEASNYTMNLLLDKNILLEKDISDRDKYGRLLRYVWFDIPKDTLDSEKNKKLFNGMLLESGLAEIATYKPDIKYLDYYKRLVEQK